MWPVRLFKRNIEIPQSEEHMSPLGCIVHLLARRGVDDEGFMISTQCMSTQEFEYHTRERVEPGETLHLKIVSGPHVLDVRGVVQTVSRNNVSPHGPAPRIAFTEMNDRDRKVLQSLIERHKACIA